MSIPYICAACGAQFADTSSEPARCPICEDSRAFGEERGQHQRWTSLPELRTNHRNRIRQIDPGVVSISTEPMFSVGHHCVLVQGEAGNLLWDCISLIDDATIEAVRDLGGISAIAISHPHFYGSMVEWSRAFGNVPIYLHSADWEWVLRSDPSVVSWEGDSLPLNEELTLVRCGGHFDGGTVLHWSGRGHRAGRLLTGDVIAVVDAENVTFMHNYPKLIPLPAAAIHRIVASIEPFEFERIYGCWPQQVIPAGGKQVVLRSAEQYVQSFAT
jgi:DNA-directed RNA polymerase subunit RPC12/RpoP